MDTSPLSVIPGDAMIKGMTNTQRMYLHARLTGDENLQVRSGFTMKDLLRECLEFAALARIKQEEERKQPPRPGWAHELEGGPATLRDAAVIARMRELIRADKDDVEIWDILKLEFTFNAQLMAFPADPEETGIGGGPALRDTAEAPRGE